MTTISKELKELEEIPSIPRPTLYAMIKGANRRDQELMASFTVMANRCSEGLAVKPSDVHKEVSIDILKLEINELAARLGRTRTEVDVGASLGRDVGAAKKELGVLYDEYLRMTDLEEAFHKGDTMLETVDKIIKLYPQTLVYVVTIQTLKRKKQVSRPVPIPVIDPLAPLFVSALSNNMGETFFELTRQRVWQLFKKAGIYAFYKDQGYPVPKNPLRHLRLTEVSNFFNRTQLYRYAGWKLKGTQDKYIHNKWDDFVEPLIKVARRAPPLGFDRV